MSSSPGVPRSTTKARWPARPALRSTVAQTTIQSARIEFEMNVLAPFSTHASPARTAVVWMAATSLPAPGSVMAKAAQCGRSRSRNGERKRSFCSGVPMPRSGGPPRPSPGIATDMPRSQYDISSARTTPRRAPAVRLDAERAEVLAAEAADLVEPRLEISVDGQVDHASEDRREERGDHEGREGQRQEHRAALVPLRPRSCQEKRGARHAAARQEENVLAPVDRNSVRAVERGRVERRDGGEDEQDEQERPAEQRGAEELQQAHRPECREVQHRGDALVEAEGDEEGERGQGGDVPPAGRARAAGKECAQASRHASPGPCAKPTSRSGASAAAASSASSRPPAICASVRMSRIHFSTGWSFMKPWPPSTCTAFGPTKSACSAASASALAASHSARSPRSSAAAARHTASRATSTAVARSAIRNASAWWWAIGRPKAVRSVA